MSALPTLSEELFIGRREQARAHIGAPGKLTLIGGYADCFVLDLSCTGARIATAEMIKPGLEALIEIDDCELFGQIVWAKKGQFGMVLDELLAVEQVIELRWQADQICQQDKALAKQRIQNWVEGKI